MAVANAEQKTIYIYQKPFENYGGNKKIIINKEKYRK